MKKRCFLEIAILVLAIIFISFAAQAYAITTNDGSKTLNSNATFLLTEESQDFAAICTAVYGNVTNRKNEFIEGVEVTAYFNGIFYHRETDEYGDYFIRLPDEYGTAYMTFKKIGYWTHKGEAYIWPYHQTRYDVTLDYCPFASTGVTVCVSNAFTDEPIQGATVYLWFDGKTYTEETGEDGCVKIELPTLSDPAPAFITVEKEHYWPSGTKSVLIFPHKWITLHFRLYPIPHR